MTDTDHHDDPKYQRLLAEARARLQGIAAMLARRLDPLDNAGAYLGIGSTLLIGSLGPTKAAEYLRELADEIAADTADLDALPPGWGRA